MDAFLAGLNDQIANRILEMFPGPRSLSAMQTIAARIDSRIAANRNFFNPQNRTNNRPKNNNNANKKKWNSNKKTSNSKFHGPLSNEEKERRRRENFCLYCGSSQHSLDNCPFKNKNKNNNKNNKPSSSSTYISNPEIKPIPRPRITDSNLPIYEFTLNIENSNSTAKILLDTSSQINLMDIYYVKENNIPYSTEINLPKVSGIGGKQTILGETLPISITYNNHKCKTQFYVVDLPSYCAILGFEWISTHNPNIDFKSKTLKFNSNHCIKNCLVIPSTFTTFISEEETISTKKENFKDDNDIQEILPAKLIPFKDVFDEKAANELPPHHPYDCEINLKPNTKPYYGAIYPLTEKETLALKEYIKDARAKGFIRNSKSSFGASVFFVPKKRP